MIALFGVSGRIGRYDTQSTKVQIVTYFEETTPEGFEAQKVYLTKFWQQV